ncbi:CAP domain-containing protein [Undibacterium sp. Ji22W]|uniref:CAP domain-containing protein n=1 Tax=Undibacterium sp. Ji22W TaxID=3413038 RepID=UPI003BF17320
MKIRLLTQQFNTPAVRRFFGLLSCYLPLLLLNTACVTEPEAPVTSKTGVTLVEPKPPIVFSESLSRSPYVHQDMSNAQCNLLDAQIFRAEVLKQVNQLRAHEQTCGEIKMAASSALVWNENLQLSAYEHAAQMAATNLFSHTSLDGRELRDRVLATGYQYAILGENIAAGQVDVPTVVQAWLRSPSHCRQMLHPEFAEFAVACVAKRNAFYVRYWVMNLGRQQIAR